MDVVQLPPLKEEKEDGNNNQTEEDSFKESVRNFKHLKLKKGDKTDPFQFFQVEHEPCHVLKVKVLCGRNITKGRIGDLMDTPDPYIIVHVPMAPDGRKMTANIDNEPNPVWEEELVFYVPPNEQQPLNIVAEIKLMDANFSVDEELGQVEFDLNEVKLDDIIKKTFYFNETSEVDIEFHKSINLKSDIRNSLALCDDEKHFRTHRKRCVYEAMRKLIGPGGPRSLRETPTIALLGSGGGFRAMTGYAGAVNALHDSGILDCVTYIAGLSGSSWYVSALYSHPDFPKKSPSVVNKEIRNNIASSPFWLLRPECLLRYSHRLRAKMKAGQPVTFTDFFGMLIGQTLLGKDRMEIAKLSDFKAKFHEGKLPMPIITCLHVRPNMSAMTFHDWMEFTPYEIGMAKYGAFVRTPHFGSKFFMGVIAKEFDESPLHYLMGIWGSAFSILFNRLVERNKKGKDGSSGSKQNDENFRNELNQELDATISEQSQDGDEDSEEEEDENEEENSESESTITEDEDRERKAQSSLEKEKRSSIFSLFTGWGGKATSQETVSKGADRKPSFLNSIVSGMFGGYSIMQTREFRAGKILNYMRGLALNQTYPLSPFTPLHKNAPDIAEANEFGRIHEPMEVRRKRVHLVDAGLTFNSPYPCVLRPQRAVDLILSFDFSARPTDNHQPFKEILLAEKYARLHHLPFPKIDPTVFDREGMKECYVFHDENNDRAPVILHFVLCNIQFRNFKAPDVPRSHNDKFGDFSIFDTPKTPYSTFNFQYPNEAFDRLHDLMEFNTKLHVQTIIEEIKNCVSLRRHSKARCSITLSDIRNSFHLSDKNKKALVKAFGSADNLPLD